MLENFTSLLVKGRSAEMQLLRCATRCDRMYRMYVIFSDE